MRSPKPPVTKALAVQIGGLAIGRLAAYDAGLARKRIISVEMSTRRKVTRQRERRGQLIS